MKKREAKFQSLFNQFLRIEASKAYGFYELKQTTKDSIPFSAVEDHQIKGLLAAQENGFIWKLSDEDQRAKPFDCFSIAPMRSFVVIKFPTCFVIIPIFVFCNLKKLSKEKSLTLEMAKKIAKRVIHTG